MERLNLGIQKRLLLGESTVKADSRLDILQLFLDQRPNCALHARKPRRIDQHRAVCRAVATSQSYCPGNAEGPNGKLEASWQSDERMALRVLHRQHILVVVDMPDHCAGIGPEDPLGTKVVTRGIKAEDEVTREEFFPKHLVDALWVDEDVGDRCRRVSDIAAPRKVLQQLTNLPIDARDCPRTVLNIDGRIISLIVDQQHGQVAR
ncbi:MAG: hypothetical protein JW395_2771 [Nitrospira sp.]|nr:hypothetical protein [Nitrospira sp.]